jgi:hypothetical protein
VDVVGAPRLTVEAEAADRQGLRLRTATVSGRLRGSSAVSGTWSAPGGVLIVPRTSRTTRPEPPGAPLATKSMAEKCCFKKPTFPGMTRTLGMCKSVRCAD